MKRSLLFISTAIGLLLIVGWGLPLGWVHAQPRALTVTTVLLLTLLVYAWLSGSDTCRKIWMLLKGHRAHLPKPDLITVLILMMTSVLTYLGLMMTYSYRVDHALKGRGIVAEAHLSAGVLRAWAEIDVRDEPQVLTYSYIDSLEGATYSLSLPDHAFLQGMHGSGQHIHVVYLPEDPSVVKPLIERKDIETHMGRSIRPLELGQLADLMGKGVDAIEAYLCTISYGWERTEGAEAYSLHNRYTDEVLQIYGDKLLYQSEAAWELLGEATALDVRVDAEQSTQNPCKGGEHQQFAYDGRVHIYLEEETTVQGGRARHLHKLHLSPMGQERPVGQGG